MEHDDLLGRSHEAERQGAPPRLMNRVRHLPAKYSAASSTVSSVPSQVRPRETLERNEGSPPTVQRGVSFKAVQPEEHPSLTRVRNVGGASPDVTVLTAPDASSASQKRVGHAERLNAGSPSASRRRPGSTVVLAARQASGPTMQEDCEGWFDSIMKAQSTDIKKEFSSRLDSVVDAQNTQFSEFRREFDGRVDSLMQCLQLVEHQISSSTVTKDEVDSRAGRAKRDEWHDHRETAKYLHEDGEYPNFEEIRYEMERLVNAVEEIRFEMERSVNAMSEEHTQQHNYVLSQLDAQSKSIEGQILAVERGIIASTTAQQEEYAIKLWAEMNNLFKQVDGHVHVAMSHDRDKGRVGEDLEKRIDQIEQTLQQHQVIGELIANVQQGPTSQAPSVADPVRDVLEKRIDQIEQALERKVHTEQDIVSVALKQANGTADKLDDVTQRLNAFDASLAELQRCDSEIINNRSVSNRLDDLEAQNKDLCRKQEDHACDVEARLRIALNKLGELQLNLDEVGMSCSVKRELGEIDEHHQKLPRHHRPMLDLTDLVETQFQN